MQLLLPLALFLSLSVALPQQKGKAINRDPNPYWQPRLGDFEGYREYCRDPARRDEEGCLDLDIPQYPRQPNNQPQRTPQQQRWECEERCFRDTQGTVVSFLLTDPFCCRT